MNKTETTAQTIYKVKAFWDAEAQIWVATSRDISGLATEAATLEALKEKLRLMVPELMQLNQLIAPNFEGYMALLDSVYEMYRYDTLSDFSKP